MLITYAFGELKINRIEAYVDERNQGCKKVLLKNGFKYEGTQRECEYEYGHYVNLELFSLLRSDLQESYSVTKYNDVLLKEETY